MSIGGNLLAQPGLALQFSPSLGKRNEKSLLARQSVDYRICLTVQ
jgi:hypothetical protein